MNSKPSKSSEPSKQKRPGQIECPDIRLTEAEIRHFIDDMDLVDDLAANLNHHLQAMEMWLSQEPGNGAPWLIGHSQMCQWLLGQIQGQFESHGARLLQMGKDLQALSPSA